MRLPKNFTARRNAVAPYQSVGRPPVYGEIVRPLSRSRKGKTIAATLPGRTETWQLEGPSIRADLWENLILPGVIPDSGETTFLVYAIQDPDFDLPWLLATPLPWNITRNKTQNAKRNKTRNVTRNETGWNSVRHPQKSSHRTRIAAFSGFGFVPE